MADFVKVASIDEVPPGGLVLVDLDGERVVLANAGGRIYALAELCTHVARPLSMGDLEGEELVCPFHGGRFDVKNGEAISLPASEPLAVYKVRIEGSDVLIATAD